MQINYTLVVPGLTQDFFPKPQPCLAEHNHQSGAVGFAEAPGAGEDFFGGHGGFELFLHLHEK